MEVELVDSKKAQVEPFHFSLIWWFSLLFLTYAPVSSSRPRIVSLPIIRNKSGQSQHVKATHGHQPSCFLRGAFRRSDLLWQGLASSFCPGRESPGPQYTSAILLHTSSSKPNRRQISPGASCVVRPPSPQDPQGPMLLGWAMREEIGQAIL